MTIQREFTPQIEIIHSAEAFVASLGYGNRELLLATLNSARCSSDAAQALKRALIRDQPPDRQQRLDAVNLALQRNPRLLDLVERTIDLEENE